MQIVIIGPYPPPIGGISNHCERLFFLLKKEKCNVTFYDDSLLPDINPLKKAVKKISGRWEDSQSEKSKENYPVSNYILPKSFFKVFRDLITKFRKEKCVVHFHKKFWKYRALLCLAAKLNSNLRIVLSIHSLRDVYEKLGFFEKIYLRFSLKNADHFIVMNNDIKNKIIRWGAAEDKIDLIPAFLPPEEKEKDFTDIPEDVWQFMENRNPVVCANAFMIRFYNGEDLYGLDLCVDLVDRIKDKFPETGFVFSIPEVGDEDYFNKTLQLIKEKNISEHFKFITKPLAFYPVLKKSDVFVRPTNTDGDALSIRESLHYNIPTVSSDVVKRPEGTILFKNRDKDDFYIKVLDVLNNPESFKSKLCDASNKSNFEQTLSVYKTVLDN